MKITSIQSIVASIYTYELAIQPPFIIAIKKFFTGEVILESLLLI
jgi:hypothetical protein